MMHQEKARLGEEPKSSFPATGEARELLEVETRKHSPEIRQPGTLRKAWKGWLKFAEVVGTVQMIIILSLIYWTLFALMAVFFRLLADPLASRRNRRSHWVQRQPVSDILDALRRQF